MCVENNLKSLNKGVVSLLNFEEIWKDIPGFPGYRASNLGNIGKIVDNSIKILYKIQYKTSVGSYLYSRVLDIDYKMRYLPVHRLVCLAFKGFPPDDGKKYEPNHIDGNKHNNKPENLEWVTRSENVTHAFNSGLCTAGIRVEIINIKTKEKHKFNTLSAAARWFNVSRKILNFLISKHTREPYLDKWIFKADAASDKKLKRYQCVEVVALNYVTGKITITNTINELARIIGVKAATLELRIRKKSLNNKAKLIRGHYVKRLNDSSPWPIFTREEALKSIQLYDENHCRLEAKKTLTPPSQ